MTRRVSHQHGGQSGLTAGRLLSLLAAAVAVLASFGGLSSAGASARTSSGQTEESAARVDLVALAGSSRYLVFARSVANAHGRPSSDATLYVTTEHGRVHRLGPVTATDGGYSLAGAMLVYQSSVAGASTVMVHWRNLSTNAHGTSIEPSDEVIAAAPNGWVTTRYTSVDGGGSHLHTVLLHTTAGHTKRLGRPSVRSAVVSLSVGGDTLVISSGLDADADPDGSAVSMSFAHPGRFHQLVAPNPNGYAACPSITSMWIACSTANNTRDTMRLYSVTGTERIKALSDCSIGYPAVVGKSLAWMTPRAGSCPRGRLVIKERHRKARFTPTKLAAAQPITAFNDVIVANPSYSKLLAYSGPTHHRVVEDASSI